MRQGEYQVIKPNGSDGSSESWQRWGRRYDSRGLANWLVNEIEKTEIYLQSGLEKELFSDMKFRNALNYPTLVRIINQYISPPEKEQIFFEANPDYEA